ncbi:MAG: hypothetical protein OXK77_18005 [Gemmatimonadota bacterium]|nr:hypothetical protein [Gemmatimonadota bacterium]MDE2942780.1 hypothetical protein [Gemmatimonadota bacterium]
MSGINKPIPLLTAAVIAAVAVAAYVSLAPERSMADRWIVTRGVGPDATFAEITDGSGEAYLAGEIRDMSWTVSRAAADLPAPHECRIADVHQILFRDGSRLVTRWRPALCNSSYEPDLRAVDPVLRSFEIIRE